MLKKSGNVSTSEQKKQKHFTKGRLLEWPWSLKNPSKIATHFEHFYKIARGLNEHKIFVYLSQKVCQGGNLTHTFRIWCQFSCRSPRSVGTGPFSVLLNIRIPDYTNAQTQIAANNLPRCFTTLEVQARCELLRNDPETISVQNHSARNVFTLKIVLKTSKGP